jgi:hypothetical protein
MINQRFAEANFRTASRTVIFMVTHIHHLYLFVVIPIDVTYCTLAAAEPPH